MNFELLPVEWLQTELGKIANVSSGIGFPKEFQGKNNQLIPVYKVSDISYSVLNCNGILQSANNTVSKDEVSALKGQLFIDGTTLFAKIGEAVKLNRRAFVKKSGLADNNVMGVKGFNNINDKYIFYFLTTIDLAVHSRSTTIPSIRKSDIEGLQIGLPPLAEQQEIVRQLEIMLAQVEQIKARLDAIPAILKKFCQSVIADAVSGKLTKEWRDSLQNDKDLDFENYIAEYRIQKYLEWEKESLLRKGKKIPSDEILLKKFKPVLSEEITHENLPQGWSRQLLDGLIYISARIGWKGLKAEEYTQEGPLFLSVHGLNYGKVVRLDQAFHISKERYDESPEIALKNDDILLCKDGAGIGKVGIVKRLDEPASINSSLLLIRSGEIFVPEFLYYVFKGPYIQKLVQERLTGTAIPHLFQRDIKEFLLDIPPLDEQKLIVEKVEAYFNWVGKIEQTVQAAQNRVNLLTQSILAKAFSGELTAEWREQHQDLITGINSAESLLAKIQAEHEASKPAKKSRKSAKVPSV